LSPRGLETDTTFYAEGLFKLLGINFASEGSKAPPFSEKFKTLGLVVDAGKANEKLVHLGHTPERASELLGTIDEILSQQHVNTKTLEQLYTWQNCLVSHLHFWTKVECSHQNPALVL
jgi:hypothetical protein